MSGEQNLFYFLGKCHIEERASDKPIVYYTVTLNEIDILNHKKRRDKQKTKLTKIRVIMFDPVRLSVTSDSSLLMIDILLTLVE